jgi:hypothetical protein
MVNNSTNIKKKQKKTQSPLTFNHWTQEEQMTLETQVEYISQVRGDRYRLHRITVHLNWNYEKKV